MRSTSLLLFALLCSCWSTAPAAAQDLAADQALLTKAGVASDGPALLEFLRKYTPRHIDPEQVKSLVRRLGAEDFAQREKAMADLIVLGPRAAPLLRQALKEADREIVLRAEDCLKKIDGGPGPATQAAVVRLIAQRKPDGAAEALLGYLPYVPDDSLVEEVARALAAVALRDGKPDAAVVSALQDKLPLKRAVAGEALCRADTPEQRAVVRKLLADPEPQVRLRVAMALAQRQEKQAVPVLIELLAVLPSEKLGRIEDVLFRLAGDEAPAPAADARRGQRLRDFWLAWWTANEAKVDLAKLSKTPAQLGYTLIVEPAPGRVMEVDTGGRVRWQIEGLLNPLSAQVLGEDRVLITEYRGNKVTERNFKGEIREIWQVPTWPVAAQRLPNGNTFIATRSLLLEYDKDGKQVFSHNVPGQFLVAAVKHRNGQISCVTTGGGLLLRLDASGKELNRFPAGLSLTFGLGIDALANGNVLAPQYKTNKVIEYDDAGKVVWQADVAAPASAARLPNGNTLVASSTRSRLVELDRNGRVVWEFATPGRPVRASRR
jgi:hypothetical protein